MNERTNSDRDERPTVADDAPFQRIVGEMHGVGKVVDGHENLRSSSSALDAVSKRGLVEIAAELRTICGDAVHRDGEVIASMERWLDRVLVDGEVELEGIRSDQGDLEQLHREIKAEDKNSLERERAREFRKRLDALHNSAASSRDMVRALGIGAFVATRDGQLSAICLARWAANGYPQIVMGHRYAAALLATNIGADVLELVKPPWNGFVIEVPNGLLTLWHPDLAKRVPVTRILVAQHANQHGGEHAWMYVAMTDTVMTLWRFGVATADLLPPTLDQDMFKDDPTNLEIDDADRRVQALVGRLIVNVCLAMSDPDLVKKIGPAHKRYAESLKRRTEPEPATRTFELGRPVRVDYRKEIAAYVEGGPGARRAVNKQWLVAGHYKRQHHGPKNALVKVIWREPYWCGPEDAPIAVRPHVLGRDGGRVGSDAKGGSHG